MHIVTRTARLSSSRLVLAYERGKVTKLRAEFLKAYLSLELDSHLFDIYIVGAVKCHGILTLRVSATLPVVIFLFI